MARWLRALTGEVTVEYPREMSEQEAFEYAAAEKKVWAEEKPGKVLGRVEISLDGDRVMLKSYEKSPIRRVRRITGYLSEMEKFNDAKSDELAARKPHSLEGGHA